MRPFKDRPCPHGEIQLASMATIKTALTNADALWLAAGRANGAVRPKPRLKILSCRFNIGKFLEELKGAYRASTHRVTLTETKSILKQ